MATDRTAKERSWVGVAWPIIAAIGYVSAGAIWFGGRLDTTVTTMQGDIRSHEEKFTKLDQTDVRLEREIEEARAERFKQLQETNDKVSYNNGRIDMLKDFIGIQLLDIHERLRVLETEKRSRP